MLTIILGLLTLIVLLNIQVGFVLMKRKGKWQYGLANWGTALILGFTLLENIHIFMN